MNLARSLTLAAGILLGGLLACSIPGQAADGQKAGVVQCVSLGYQEDRQTTAFRSTVTADTNTAAGILALPAFGCQGRKNISVTPCLSAAGATISFKIAYVNTAGTDVLALTDPVVFTSSTTPNAAGEYLCPAYDFSSRGYYSVRIVCTTSASSGTCPHVNVGSY